MNIELNSTAVKQGTVMTTNQWTKCSCSDKDCHRVFLGKLAMIEALNPFMKKYADLPLDLEFTSFVNHSTGMMTIVIRVEQLGDITQDQLDQCHPKQVKTK